MTDVCINVSPHVLDRKFFIDKINQQIEAVEEEFNKNCDELELIADKVFDIPHKERNKTNPEYDLLAKRRCKLSHRNKTLQKHIKQLNYDLQKYSTIEI